MKRFMTTVALATLVASAAFAYEDPENKIGDRYLHLEQIYTPVSANSLGSRNLMPRQVSNVSQNAYEDPENKIGDRYLHLAQIYTPVSANSLGSRNLMPRQVSKVSQFAYEAPENKIGDRYPFLEQAYSAEREPTRSVV